MQQTVESNKTLLVDGPASVQLLSGKAEVFGYQVRENARVVVRQGKRLPFSVVEKALFEVGLGANAGVQEVEGNTIPSSWGKVYQEILSVQKRPVVVLVLGQADAGKSSLCTYLTNKLVEGKRCVAVLDGDIGQSDIGPSAAVAYALTSKPQTELYNLKMENGIFIGNITPISAIAQTVEALNTLKIEILKRPIDFMLINTDGWVSGDIAVRYKTALFNAIKPDMIIGIQIQDELTLLIANRNAPTFIVEPSPALSPRPADKRKILREMTYARHLKHSKLQCYPISQLTVEPRKAIPKNQQPQNGLLVGLYGRSNRFLGIGVLRYVDTVRRVLKVQTAVSSKPVRLIIGKVMVNRKLQETKPEI